MMFMRRCFIPVGLLAAVAISLFACGDNPLVPRLDPVNEEEIVFFSDFNEENGGEGMYNYTDFAEWNVVDGCVDLHGNGFFDVWPNNGLYVDLDGSCRQGGTLETKEELQLPNGEYVLEFWLAGNNRREEPDTVIVELGDLHSEQIIKQREDPFRLYSRSIIVDATTTARLSFQNLGRDNHGAFLDLVRLRRVP